MKKVAESLSHTLVSKKKIFKFLLPQEGHFASLFQNSVVAVETFPVANLSILFDKYDIVNEIFIKVVRSFSPFFVAQRRKFSDLIVTFAGEFMCAI